MRTVTALLVVGLMLSVTWGVRAAEQRYLRVAYFVPADREPCAEYGARLGRVMEEVQRFYREGMKANGYGPLTFELERDAQGALRIYLVKGKEPAANYGRDGSAKVRGEVKQGLKAQGLDMEQETVVVFQVLLDWKDGKAIEVGPYVGGGGGGRGTAWVYDDPHLDPQLLPSKEPGGYYVRPCSWGQFNTHYIGGVAHELGHALGLPHDAETAAQRREFGASLMGGGNHTYGQEKRGEGKGTFLSPGSAMALAKQPLFRNTANVSGEADCRLSGLRFTADADGLRITGAVTGPTKAFGLIAYNDNQAIRDDYDAVNWTCPVGNGGKFDLHIGDPKPTRYELRLKLAGEDGRFRVRKLEYAVGKDGAVDVAVLQQGVLLGEADAAYAARDAEQLDDLGQALAEIKGGEATAAARVAHLRKLLRRRLLTAPGDVPADQREVAVSALVFAEARTGYGPAVRDQVLREGDGSVLLLVGGEFFDAGLYAHAPALHEVATSGGWKKLQAAYGIQDGRDGSVVFVIRGDGKELFRSAVVRDHVVRKLEVDLTGVKTLQLLTEDAGDGARGDWGVWLAPKLMR